MGFRLTFFLNTVSRLASTVAARNISPAIVPMISACTARSSVWRMIETPSEVSVSRRRSRSTDFTLPLQGYLPLTSGPFTTIARWSMVSLVLQTGRQEILRGRELLPCPQVGNRSDKCFWRKPSITHQQLARLGTRGSMTDDIDNRLRQLCELAKLEHQPDKIKVLAQEIAQLLVEKLKCQPPDRKAG